MRLREKSKGSCMAEARERKVLVMTIGVGDAAKLEETLFTPLRKSIAKGEWARVVLLPSTVSAERAEYLRAGWAGQPIQIEPLPEAGMEDDADACFAHFDAMLEGLLAEGIGPDRVVADFTRGTKAMTAALTLAAAGRGVRALRYITGERNASGTVTPGTEQIHDFLAERVTFRRDLDLASRFLETWQFRSAERLVSANETVLTIHPERWRRESRWIAWLAGFWGAWDRFDYAEAVRLLNEQPDGRAPAPLAHLDPDGGRIDFIRALAAPLPGRPEDRAEPVRNLAADTLENGRRRLQLGELEDALIRAYRVLELIGQIRLFTHGQDSAGIDPEWMPAKEWLTYRARKKKPIGLDESGRLKLPRLNVASLLQHMGDPLGKPLCNSKKFGGLDPELRNASQLIHGYRVSARTETAADLEKTYTALERLFEQEHAGNQRRLVAARFPNANSNKSR